MKFRIFGRLQSCILVAAVLIVQSQMLRGQSDAPAGASSAEDAAKRMEWLKSRLGSSALPQATPAPLKKHFSDRRSLGLRPAEPVPEPSDTPKKQIAASPATTPAASTPTPAPRITETHATPRPKAAKVAEASSPAPATPAPTPRIATHTSEPPAKTAHSLDAPVTPKPSPAAHVAEAHTPTPHPAIAHNATPSPAPNTHAVALRTPETPAPAKATPVPSRPQNLAIDTRITDMHSLQSRMTEEEALRSRPAVTHASTVAGHYPWKTGIVTTVFWVGEPVGGHNFTPNYASSWDANWARTYGGYDNPDPNGRRNFIPVNFTPRQNPFYCALPYNDVTRGTTKPEARVMIPWFREAFRKEGQSVCRDRWVAIHSRTGRIAYAQWSDCGPFRTDHWQYVFGSEKPRPNLNQGAGLDVSPAVRDYLGLQSTDVTDWKFVDDKDVPSGPWALYGDNNTCAQRGSRLTRAAAAPDLAVTRIRAY